MWHSPSIPVVRYSDTFDTSALTRLARSGSTPLAHCLLEKQVGIGMCD